MTMSTVLKIALIIFCIVLLCTTVGFYFSYQYYQMENERAAAEAAQDSAMREHMERERLEEQARKREMEEAEARRRPPSKEERDALIEELLGPRIPELAPEWGARARACKTKRDCAFTNPEDGRCCSTCGWNAYSRKFVIALEQHRKKNCPDPNCTAMHCTIGRKNIPEVRCVNNVCDSHYPLRDANRRDPSRKPVKTGGLDELLDELAL